MDEDSPRWELRWGRQGAVKWVTISDRLTGVEATGRDWQSWEEARHQAVDRLWSQVVAGAWHQPLLSRIPDGGEWE
ncbi:MAG: hypothetical protein ACE5KX_05200 [Acidimicrobiia bacterium]